MTTPLESPRLTSTELMHPLSVKLANEGWSVAELVKSVAATPIQSQAQYDELAEGVKEAKRRWAELDAQRKAYVQDPTRWVKKVNEFYRPALDAYEALERAIKIALGSYTLAAKAEQARLQAAAGAAFQSGDAPRAQQALAALSQAPPVATAPGVAVRETWDVEVSDLESVPREFLVPDLDALRAHVRATNGAPIPGCKVFKRADVAVRRGV